MSTMPITGIFSLRLVDDDVSLFVSTTKMASNERDMRGYAGLGSRQLAAFLRCGRFPSSRCRSGRRWPWSRIAKTTETALNRCEVGEQTKPAFVHVGTCRILAISAMTSCAGRLNCPKTARLSGGGQLSDELLGGAEQLDRLAQVNDVMMPLRSPKMYSFIFRIPAASLVARSAHRPPAGLSSSARQNILHPLCDFR